MGKTARELNTEEFLQVYLYRWLVEINFFVAQDKVAMEMWREWMQRHWRGASVCRC